MSIAIVTGSAGLIGSEASQKFHAEGFDVIGIDNDMRARFFGPEASTADTRRRLQASLKRYQHEELDIRDTERIERLIARLGSDVKVIIHTAAQPSHDWAASDPHTDFQVNAIGTLNLLEAARTHCPDAVFIFTSTNKVYGDTPNRLPLARNRCSVRDRLVASVSQGHRRNDVDRSDQALAVRREQSWRRISWCRNTDATSA